MDRKNKDKLFFGLSATLVVLGNLMVIIVFVTKGTSALAFKGIASMLLGLWIWVVYKTQ